MKNIRYIKYDILKSQPVNYLLVNQTRPVNYLLVNQTRPVVTPKWSNHFSFQFPLQDFSGIGVLVLKLRTLRNTPKYTKKNWWRGSTLCPLMRAFALDVRKVPTLVPTSDLRSSTTCPVSTYLIDKDAVEQFKENFTNQHNTKSKHAEQKAYILRDHSGRRVGMFEVK